MNWLRLVLGVVAASVFLLALGPVRLIARSRGSSFGRGLPIAFHRLLCATLDLRVRQIGQPGSLARRLIVANHVSWLDIPALGAREPISFLAKKEVGERWLGRLVVALQGGMYVDRRRKRVIPEVNAAMAAAMRRGETVVLFAEATTGDGNRMLRFRSSHFDAARQASTDGAAQVQPVFVRYSRIAGLPVARIDRPTVAWYGDMTFFPHLWEVVRSGGIECEVHYGDPMPVRPDASGKALALATERAVRELAERARGGERGAIPAGRETR